jgi:hypothetical protein
MFFFGGGLLYYVFAIAMCVHVVRTNREMYWLFIILALPPLGGVIYLITNVLPDLVGGSRARQLGRAARETLDPTRDYRLATRAHEDAPTVSNKMKLAQSAFALERFDEAERLYGEALQGIHAEDPTLLLGRAHALIELGRFPEALTLLDQLGKDPDKGRTPATALALGRTYEGLGRFAEADTAYQWASGRLPGLEGIARYAAFLARTGRRDEAQEAVAEMDQRVAKARGHFKAEARAWRNLAAEALG